MTRRTICFSSAFREHYHFARKRILRCCALLAVIIVGGGMTVGNANAVITIPPKTNTAVVSRCKADLAQRIHCNSKEMTLVEVQAMIWPDAALGLPEHEKAYIQQQIPGWRVVIEARGNRYIYTASRQTIRYGGPLSLLAGSMLYVLPVENEPNLNGDLYQCTLLGTNHVRLLAGVADYYPQANGVVLVTRRISRSSFELLSMKAGKGGKAQTLHTAFAFGGAALNDAQNTWAAFVKPGVGADWRVIISRVGRNAAEQSLPLPEGVRPQRIAWSGERVVVLVTQDEKSVCFEISLTAEAPAWKPLAAYLFPGMTDFMLNKSETLEITQHGDETHPRVEVARVWFTGDRKLIATIDGLALRGYDLVGAGYALVWGERDGKVAAYTVNIASGEIITTYQGNCRDIKPFHFPPVTFPYQVNR